MKTQKLKIWIGIIFNAFSLIVMAGSIEGENPGFEFEKDFQNIYTVDSIYIESPVMHYSKVDTSYHYIKIGTSSQSKFERNRTAQTKENRKMEFGYINPSTD